MKQMTLFPLLSYYNNLSDNDDYKHICRILLQNMTRIGNMSIHEAAEICYTSPATISRIAKRAGFGGYQGLKEAATLNCANYFNENRVLTVDQVADGNVSDTYLNLLIECLYMMKDLIRQEEIDQAAALLHDSDYIISVGPGQAAEQLEMNLFFDGKYFESVNLHEDKLDSFFSTYKDKKVAAILFNQGYPWMKSNHEYVLKKAGFRVILITTPQYRPNDTVLDCIIRVPGTKTSFDAIFHFIILTIIGMSYRKEYIDSWFHRKTETAADAGSGGTA